MKQEEKSEEHTMALRSMTTINSVSKVQAVNERTFVNDRIKVFTQI